MSNGTRAASRRAHAPARVLSALAPNATLVGALLCLPTAPALPPEKKGDFGTSPIYGQLSDKPLLAFGGHYGVPHVKHNRDREIKRRAPSCRSTGLRPRCRFDPCRLNYTRDVGFRPLASFAAAQRYFSNRMARVGTTVPAKTTTASGWTVIVGSLPGRGRSSSAAIGPSTTARSTQRWTV